VLRTRALKPASSGAPPWLARPSLPRPRLCRTHRGLRASRFAHA